MNYYIIGGCVCFLLLTWEELQRFDSCWEVVFVAVRSLIIALIIFLMDSVFSRLMELFYDFF